MLKVKSSHCSFLQTIIYQTKKNFFSFLFLVFVVFVSTYKNNCFSSSWNNTCFIIGVKQILLFA